MSELRVRALAGPADAEAVVGLFADVWRLAPTDPAPVDSALLLALAHGGNYVALAETGPRQAPVLVGGCVGFLSAPESAVPITAVALHSHIAGVRPGHTGSGVGGALKLDQRDWCRRRGIELISWTFDPLVARNAHFNLNRLGARAAAYLVDFYGAMTDGLNAGQPSDRLLVEWSVNDHPPHPADHPARAGTDSELVVGIPDDIEALRITDPAAALDWRYRLRDQLGPRLRDGWTVDGFERGRGYRLRRSRHEGGSA